MEQIQSMKSSKILYLKEYGIDVPVRNKIHFHIFIYFNERDIGVINFRIVFINYVNHMLRYVLLLSNFI